MTFPVLFSSFATTILSTAPLQELGIIEGPFESVQVNVDFAGADVPDDSGNEPSLAIDALNRSRVAIGWRRFPDTADDPYYAGVAYSTDAGRTWSEQAFVDVLAGQPLTLRSDPVLDYSSDGRFYYYALNRSAFPRTCDLFISTDGGQSWTMDTDADLVGGDKPWIAVDRTGGPGDGNVYIHWNWRPSQPLPVLRWLSITVCFSDTLPDTMPVSFA